MQTAKTAFVTGASRGIGFAIAKQLADDGYHIIAAASSFREETDKVFADAFTNGYTYVYGDIKEKTVREHFIETIRAHGRIDLLVNNAGVAPPVRRDILETTEDSFDFVLDTNLKAVFFLTQAVANLMIALKQSADSDYTPRIINIGSMSAYVSSTSRGEYCISKAGVSMVTALFADRLAEYGIPVFEIRPGIIKTDMTSAVTEKYDRLIAGGITPTKRWGEPEDIARIASAIAAGNFDFSTGQVFDADGGFHLRRL